MGVRKYVHCTVWLNSNLKQKPTVWYSLLDYPPITSIDSYELRYVIAAIKDDYDDKLSLYVERN